MEDIKEEVVQEKEHDTVHYDLRGTFTFVMFLGIFMIISWIAVYYLFISR